MADVLSPTRTEQTLTRGELRRRIATEVGCRTNPETPLDKSTLNSIYAYKMGEFAVRPFAENKPEHPHFVPRQAVLLQVVGAYQLAEPGDEWCGTSKIPKELRRDELEQVATTIDTTPDQREWTP